MHRPLLPPSRPVRRRLAVVGLLAAMLAAAGVTAPPPTVWSAPAPQNDAPIADSGLSWNAKPLFGGNYEHESWTGVAVSLNNDGPARDVELVIEGTGQNVDYRTSVELPRGARKELILPFLPSRYGGGAIYLETQGRQREQRRLTLDGEDDLFMILVIGDDDPRLVGLEGLAIATGRVNSPARIVREPAKNLPDHPLLFDAIEHVIVADSLAGATEAQRQALVQWVRLGGQVTVLGGTRGAEATAGLPPELRAAESAGVEIVPGLQSLGRWVASGSMGTEDLARPATVARLRPVDGATVEATFEEQDSGEGAIAEILREQQSREESENEEGQAAAEDDGALEDEVAGDEAAENEVDGGAPEEFAAATLRGEELADLPLIVKRDVGDGVVVALAVDPGVPPLRGWAGDETMWMRLHVERPGSVHQALVDERFMPQSLAAAAGIERQSGLPSPMALFLVLASYVVVVGPINYMLLRSRRRLDLAWVTIPALTLAFTGLSYAFGLWLHGGTLQQTQYSVVRVPVGGGVAHVQGWVDLSSPASRDYDFDLDGAWAHPLRSEGRSVPQAGQMQLIFGGDGALRDLSVAQWSNGGFAFEAVVPWPFVEEVAGDGLRFSEQQRSLSDVQGTVGSPFDRPVDGAYLFYGPRSMPLPAWSGSGRINVEGAIGQVPNSYTFAGDRPERRRLASAFYDPQNGYYGNPSTSRRLLGSSRFAPSEAVLAGWSDDPPVTIGIERRRAAVDRPTLLLGRVPIEGQGRTMRSRGGNGGGGS